jgi:hypothetical protein
LFRIVEEEFDANGNTLSAATITVANWFATPTEPGSCKELLQRDASLQNGTYAIIPDPAETPRNVFCDMTTDGGGWTLVASSKDAPPRDQAAGYYSNLSTMSPFNANLGIWTGLRGLIVENADIRFACKLDPLANTFDVDLSFYDNDWYHEITNGTDQESCFNVGNNGNSADPPARTNNLTGETLPKGDSWTTGSLEGEDSCDDLADFTVDFDDRGMDSNQSDGTDWGDDDGDHKCGVSGTNTGAWFIFVRE